LDDDWASTITGVIYQYSLGSIAGETGATVPISVVYECKDKDYLGNSAFKKKGAEGVYIL